jgi:hypothetical protein
VGVSQISPHSVRFGKFILILIIVRFLTGESIGLEHLRSSRNRSDLSFQSSVWDPGTQKKNMKLLLEHLVHRKLIQKESLSGADALNAKFRCSSQGSTCVSQCSIIPCMWDVRSALSTHSHQGRYRKYVLGSTTPMGRNNECLKGCSLVSEPRIVFCVSACMHSATPKVEEKRDVVEQGFAPSAELGL